MYAHNDLESGGPEYPLDEECGVSGDSIGVYALNDKCSEDYRRRVDVFRDWVVDHEHEHQNSLNKCIRAVNSDGRLAAVESIVEETEGAAEDEAKKLWTEGLVPALIDAKTTAQQGDSTNFMHWRASGRWEYGGKTGDHSGTDGCPQI